MNICVLVKQVPDPEAQIEVAEGAETASVEEKYMLNFFDSIAVEQAMLLKEKAGATVTAVSVGPDRVVEALRTCVAMGCDRAVRIFEPALEKTDHLAVARTLAAFLEKEPHDLVLAGRAALDDESAAVGPMVAGLLGVPHVGGVTALVLAENSITCTTMTEGTERVFELPLPALVTAEKGLCEPRVPQIMGVMKAMKMTPETLDLAALGLDAGRVAPLVTPTVFYPKGERAPVRMVDKDDPSEAAGELARLLRNDAKII